MPFLFLPPLSLRDKFFSVSSSRFGGSPVAQWVKRWPTDLAVTGSTEIFSIVNGVPLHTAFHYHTPIVLI